MKKILFVIGSMQIGGAETVMVDLINKLCDKFEVTILLVEKRGELITKINKNVKVKSLTKSKEYCHSMFEYFFNKVKLSLIYRCLYKSKLYVSLIYRRILGSKYDVEIAFLAGVPSYLVSKSPNSESKKLVWIHATVDSDNKQYSILNKYFDNIICVSEKSMNVFAKKYPECKDKLKLIYNYIDVEKIQKKSNEKVDFETKRDVINFVSVGRLSKEKGYDRIISIANKFKNRINFYIIGGGSLESELKEKIVKNDINNVFLLGLKKNPYPYIKKADYFLLSLRSEAYPTVVIEAMLLNKTILATDVSGVSEILKNYQSKLIIKNSDSSLEKGIEKILKISDFEAKSKNGFEQFNTDNLNKVISLFNEK